MTESTAPRPWLVPLVVAIAFLMEGLDTTIVTTAIPAMARALHVSVVQLNLAVSAYVLTLAVFVPVSGWLADRLGARSVFIAALTVFTLGSALCGIATDFIMLIFSRVIQGLGGALLTPVGRLILLHSFPRSQLVKAMTYATLPAMIGPIIGPLFGGYLTTYASWRWVFYVNLPFGILGIFLAYRFIHLHAEAETPPFDFSGFLMFGAGIGLIQWALEILNQHSAGWVAFLLLSATALLGAYWWRSRSRPHSAVDLRLLRNRAFGIATLGGGLSRIAMNGPVYLLPLLLQLGLGMNPLQSGAFTFLSIWGSLIVRVLIGRMLRLVGFRVLLVGSALFCSLVLANFSLIGIKTTLWWIAVDIVLFGFARAIQFMTSNTLAYADIDQKYLSRATSLGGLFQQLTVSFGVSLSAAFLSALSNNTMRPSLADFHAVFLILAILPLFSIPLVLHLQQQDGAQVRV
ncbi:DHA2 family efflux MFS transporter permease subunit [Acidithiobacillus ferriphilus]|nr:DHA2 family efflux MFS transporter permease subunit [Acidithiobacillus ferriphilus]